MTLKAVFFDLDGTLLDTAKDLGGALNKTLIEDGLAPLPDEQARCIVSEGSFALVKTGYQLEDDDARIPALRQRLLDHYLADLSTHTVKFPGVDALIETLHAHGIVWGIATNKPAPYADPLMQRYEFASPPICLLCPEHVQQRKPHPESLHLACEKAGCQPRDAIYIGDHRRDIECGNRAGMPTIGVSYGYIPKDEDIHSWEATHYVDSVEALWPIIERYMD